MQRSARLLAAIALSEGITAALCVAFNGTVRLDFMVTGLVCAVVVSVVIERVTRHYRRQLREVNAQLEQRVAERTAELERVSQELVTRDRMATAGALASAVSHEIRTPLSVIKLAVDEVREGPLPADARAALDDVAEATDRITVILRDLSTIATPIEQPLGAVDVRSVIDSAVRLVSYQLGKTTRLERGPCDVPAVRGNPPRLVQVVLNLLVNAGRAARPDEPCRIRVGAEQAGDEVIVRVSDTGVGMDEETRARLFEPYFTTRRDRGGTGLGLAICKGIVEAAGGHIEVDSAPGRGTTMSVHLALFREVAAEGRVRYHG